MSRILVIEDEQELRTMLAEELADLGHDVAVAENGAAGLEQVDARDPQLIFCDLAMPVMAGLDFLRAYARRPAPRAPVIVVSAYGAQDDLKAAEAAGADGYLRKPIDFDEMEALLDARLAAD